jgi:hypothetical protein
VEVSKRFNVTPQTVNKAFNAIDAKISKALSEAANVNRLEVRKMDTKQGYLLGYSFALNREALVTFSSRNGVQVWYRGEGSCESCGWQRSCREVLLGEAEERGIKLPEGSGEMEPSRLADYLFDRILEVKE